MGRTKQPYKVKVISVHEAIALADESLGQAERALRFAAGTDDAGAVAYNRGAIGAYQECIRLLRRLRTSAQVEARETKAAS